MERACIVMGGQGGFAGRVESQALDRSVRSREGYAVAGNGSNRPRRPWRRHRWKLGLAADPETQIVKLRARQRGIHPCDHDGEGGGCVASATGRAPDKALLRGVLETAGASEAL
jgi:hypothetical protein